MVHVKLDVFVQKNLKWPIPSLWIKLKFNWIKTLNMRLDTLNLIKEKIAKSLDCSGIAEDFLNQIPIALELWPGD